MSNQGYLESFDAQGYVKEAAASADAAASVEHALVPPAIALPTDFVMEQQQRFQDLALEGRPGADALYGVYVNDEILQGSASTSYDEFVSSARLATQSVVRYDSLLQNFDADEDLRNNFALDPKTTEQTTEALQEEGAHMSGVSVTDALTEWQTSRRSVLSTGRKVKASALRLRSSAMGTKIAGFQVERAEIDQNIEDIGTIAELIEMGVKAATGSADASMLGSAAEKGAALAGGEIDVSVGGAAKAGARLYYAEEIQKLEKQIAGGKKLVKSLDDVAAASELQSLLDDLATEVAELATSGKRAETAMDARRKQYAGAGKAVDGSAGIASEALLLGSASEEAALLVKFAQDAGATAAQQVADARANARKRGQSYHTGEDTFEINGNAHYFPRGRTDNFGDDPDVTALYQMEKAIQKWQAAAASAATHLGGTNELFRANITDKAGASDY